MLRLLPLLIAIPLVIAYGVTEGFWTNRWTLSSELKQAAERLDKVPLSFGEWQGQTKKIEQRFLEQGEVSGYILRDYVNPKTGETVQVLIICGLPGPTSVHTPDVCYRGAGYVMAAQETRHSEKVKSLAQTVEMWTANFRKPQSPISGQLRIYWTWTVDGQWNAPSSPRWQYAGQKILYKMYLVHQDLEDRTSGQDKTCMDFLHEFVPRVNQTLFPPAQAKN